MAVAQTMRDVSPDLIDILGPGFPGFPGFLGFLGFLAPR
ncbi:putative membrane protein [Mycobacterium kansasii 732]|nr:putative membrane protein [Mycobacterium kansasii 732]